MIIDIRIPFDQALPRYLKENFPEYSYWRVLAENIDARGAQKGKRPQAVYRIELSQQAFEEKSSALPQGKKLGEKPLIIGAGPAGLFCALRFCDYGIPVTLVERGDRARERMKKIARFWRYGELDENSNVCYGEGGAGLFSDGKLITRIKSPLVDYVMQRLVDFGAPPEIRYQANPHLGSNKIRDLIQKISTYLEEKGCSLHYQSPISELLYDQDKIIGARDEKGVNYHSPWVVLAPGHSPLDLFQHLEKNNIAMKLKDFALGVRMEHPRRLIDQLQYGNFSQDLKSARYRLSYHQKETDTGVYSFCMCPGGYVLSSGTERDGLVVNGMSNSGLNSPWSNSAIVVTIKSAQFKNILEGFHFQRKIEKACYSLSQEKASGRELPAMFLEDFLQGKIKERGLTPFSSPSGAFLQDFSEVFPDSVMTDLRQAFLSFDSKIQGLIHPEAVLFAPETRTSSPLQIERDKDSLESLSHQGLFPCGEGAGHAGGITSAAVDGIRVCESIIKNFSS